MKQYQNYRLRHKDAVQIETKNLNVIEIVTTLVEIHIEAQDLFQSTSQRYSDFLAIRDKFYDILLMPLKQLIGDKYFISKSSKIILKKLKNIHFI